MDAAKTGSELIDMLPFDLGQDQALLHVVGDRHIADAVEALDARVQLFFLNTSKYEFLSLYGMATVTRDRQKIDELWTDIAKAWFPEGKDDPRVTVIKVTPEDGFYWDTKDGKLVSMVKILASAVAGKTFTEGVEGTIAVK